MTDRLVLSIRDNSDKVGTMTCYIPSIDETTYVATRASALAIKNAVAAVTAGNIISVQLTHNFDFAGLDDVVPEDKGAQREIKARFYWTDLTNGLKGNFSIPAADLQVITTQGSDDISLEAGWAAAIKTAMEALATSKVGGAITVTSAKQVTEAS